MRPFLRKIRQSRNRNNFHLILKNAILVVALYLLIVNLFFVFYVLAPRQIQLLFLFAMSLKIFFGLLLIYFVLHTSNILYDDNQAARLLDKFNDDINDTYQNGYELNFEGKEEDRSLLEIVFQSADQKAETQVVKGDLTRVKQALLPLIITLFISTTFAVFAPKVFLDSFKVFSSSKRIQIEYRDYIEVIPGNLAIPRNTSFTIEVVDPEPEVEHTLFYSYGEHWRSETMYQNKKTFANSDLSFEYYVQSLYAVSDTFKVDVFEEPAVRELTLKYKYPLYTKLESETVNHSNGNIRGIVNTEVTIEIESNNPLEEAKIIFSDGDVLSMERLGKNLFKGSFMLSHSGSYRFKLIDFLGNESRKFERSITVIPDRLPEIKIVYPGRDTIFTQNMMQPLKAFATDDFGLQNLQLFYQINEGETVAKNLKESVQGTTLEFDHLFDLSDSFMLPGDRVLYWMEIYDNAPTPQKGVSKHYFLRFPSIEEIFAEIQKEEEQKMSIMQSSIEASQELQKEFEEKRREMLKRDQYDWEDKKELEEYLERQDELNQTIEKVAEEYQQLLEKFADNPSLSDETLEKMRRMKELMDEITDDRFKEAMSNLQQAMEQMNRDDVLKAMEDFKFSMEDFEKKLQSTLELLEDIKKEQNVQKALAISKEMEQLQEELNKKTEAGEESSEKLSKEQEKIKEKLDALKEQLEETMASLDEENDKDILKQLQELQDMMEESGLDDDLMDSISALDQNQMEQAMQKQKEALQKMKEMTQKLNDISQSMQQGNMAEIGDIIEVTIRRLLTLTELHQNTANKYVRDPFPIYADLISGYDAIQLTLTKLYSVPQVALFITSKFVMDVDLTLNAYREIFKDISNNQSFRVASSLSTIHKGLNLLTYNLMQVSNDMSGGSGSGMQSLLQSMKKMGKEQMAMNMLTQQMMDQLGNSSNMTQEMRRQMSELAKEEQRLADNLKRMLETSPEAQRQASGIKQLIDELEAVSRQLRQNKLDESLIGRQERILSRLLDAQKSINQREFSQQRKGEMRVSEDWELPPDILQEFETMRQKALLKDDFKGYPHEYQELIREYLRLLNLRTQDTE